MDKMKKLEDDLREKIFKYDSEGKRDLSDKLSEILEQVLEMKKSDDPLKGQKKLEV